MAELYARALPDDLKPPDGWDADMKPPDLAVETRRRQLQADLPGQGSLDTQATGQLLIDEISVGVHALAGLLDSAGLATLQMPDFLTLVRWNSAEGRYSLAHAVLNFHIALLTNLQAADQAIGKGYGLGRAMADLVLRPRKKDEALFREDFRAGRVITLTQDLQDLKSALPPHAGEAVGGSIAIWQKWAAAPNWHNRALDWASDRPEVLSALSARGNQWRLLLAGDKSPLDQLRAADYVEAGGFLIGRLRQLASKYASQYWVALLVVVALVIVGIIVAATLLASPAAKAIGIAVSLLAGLGVTSASAASALTKAARSAEGYLWEAELDLAIARACTTLPLHAFSTIVGEPLPPSFGSGWVVESLLRRGGKSRSHEAADTHADAPVGADSRPQPL